MTLIAERLREILSYNPETGVFTWLVSTSNRVRVGSVAGTMQNRGYQQMTVDNRRYLAHRLVWLYVHGEWPPTDIDHINGVRNDNRLANLRLATNTQNQANSRKRADNTSGFKGVCWDARDHKWKAHLHVNGRQRHLGYFDCPAAAHRAYLAAAEKLHGEFARAE
jgi:hypothetical protein